MNEKIECDNFMDLQNAILKGAKYGFILSVILNFILLFSLSDFSSEQTVTLAELLSIEFGLVLLATVTGGLIGLVAVGTFNVINWVVAFLGASFLSFLSLFSIETGLFGILAGWASVVFLSFVVPILLFARKYLSEKSPIWIEKSINEAIVMILTSLFVTFFAYFFQSITCTPLLGLS